MHLRICLIVCSGDVSHPVKPAKMLDVALWRALVVFVNVRRSVSTICSRQLIPAFVTGLQLHEMLEDELSHHRSLHPRPSAEPGRIRHRLDERTIRLTFASGRPDVLASRTFGVRKIVLRDLPGTTLFAFSRWPKLVAPHSARSYFTSLWRRFPISRKIRKLLASNRHI